MTHKLFDSMDPASKRFYMRIFNTAALNMHAVRRGFFDMYICDMTEPMDAVRWNEAMPQVLLMIQNENRKP